MARGSTISGRGRPIAIVVAVLLLFLSAGCHGTSSSIARSTAEFPPGTGFVKHMVELDGEPREMWVFVPRDYQPRRNYPAIVFLHGLFESGRNADACLSAGLGPVIARNPAKWPFVTVFPQSDGTWKGERRERLVLKALEFAQSKYRIDADRVILAGLSYGALGTWEIGARNTDRFAALVPVSGHRATELVERLGMLPVWAFVMTGDMFVSPRSSQDMCEQLQARGGRAKLTEFKGVGHDCWDRAVAESDLVTWMLAQRRRAPATPDPTRGALAGAGGE